MTHDDVFTALSDRTRRSIVEALSSRGPCTATQLASDLPITRQAVAKHLGHLHRAGLVTPHRQGRETLYRIVAGSVDVAISWLEDISGATADQQRAA